MQIDGRRVAQLRRDLGYSQERLAELVRQNGAELKQTQMSKIENSWPGSPGVSIPRCIRELAIVLKTTQDYLLGISDDPQPPRVSTTNNEDHKLDHSPLDGAVTVLLSVWEIAQYGASGVADLALLRTANQEAAPDYFARIERAFCIRVWDDSNAPYVPRDSTLFVNPGKRGRIGNWCLFFQSVDLAAGTIRRPVFGLLDAQEPEHWAVRQGLEMTRLAMAERPLTYLIELIKVI